MSDQSAATEYEAMSADELRALSAQLDQERVALNEKIAAVNGALAPKEAEQERAEAEARRSAPAEPQTVEHQGIESGESVGPR